MTCMPVEATQGQEFAKGVDMLQTVVHACSGLTAVKTMMVGGNVRMDDEVVIVMT